MKSPQRKPAAFRVDDLTTVSADYVPGLGARAVLTPEIDPFAETAAPVVPLPKRRVRWSRLLFAGLGGLFALAVGLAIDALIRDLFSRSDALGWFGVALAALAGLAVIAILVREIVGLLRIRAVTALHAASEQVMTTDDRDAARRVAREVMTLYHRRPETARGRNALAGHMSEIIDGRDLIGLAETEIMLPLDEQARRMVLSAAKRVALVTTVSPRAIVDILFVTVQIVRLIRQIATLYAGRPGTLGFFRLLRAAVTHLAVTGGIAAGDSLVQQILGHGLAARLSARLGEGVINGLLTARVGIAAIEVCRPLPFVSAKPPRLGDVMAELRRMSSDPKDVKADE